MCALEFAGAHCDGATYGNKQAHDTRATELAPAVKKIADVASDLRSSRTTRGVSLYTC